MRTVVIISYHYLPSTTPGSLRVDAIARELSGRGWRVIVLTGTGPAPAGESSPGVEVVRTTSEPLVAADAGVPLISSPRVVRRSRIAHAVAFPDKYVPWFGGLTRALDGLLRTEAVDVVFSTSPPHSSQLAVAWVRRRRRFAWLAEFRDPWMHPSRRRVSPLSGWVQRRMERFVLGSCDRVVANTPGNREALLAAMPRLDPTRVVVLPNGFEEEVFAGPPPSRSTTDLTYVGELYPGMTEVYARAVRELHRRDPASVPSLEIFGSVDPHERRFLSDSGLDPFIRYRGFVPHRDSVAAMRAARALLVLLPAQPRWAACVPSKVYWYLGSGRPMIAFVPDGDTAHVLRETGAGWPITTTDAAAAGSALAEALACARASHPTRPNPDRIAAYRMAAISERLEAELQGVVDGPAR